MRKIFVLIIAWMGWVSCSAQYISEVLEYCPAPGQHINAAPWGNPYSTTTIKGSVNGSLSLGAFGGYVVFKFDNPVKNHPDNPFGVDFTIFGNPMTDLAEPGIVYVMQDENQNGIADDTWFELSGSDYYFSTSRKDYTVTYTNPGDTVASDIPWSDNSGIEGFIFANPHHTQPYYPNNDSFPLIPSNQYMLSGSFIELAVDTSNPVFVRLPAREFGYADNRSRGLAPYTVPDNPYTLEKENAGGDAFDIDWAVDTEGNYVSLEEVDFIKVQTAVLADAGWLGEGSTEITGAVDVAPDNTISGVLDMIVIKDLPKIITTNYYQLEVYVFHKGRPEPQWLINWSTTMPGAQVDENNLLTVTETGELELTASLADNPDITSTVNTTINLSASVKEYRNKSVDLVYPNPADEWIQLITVQKSPVRIFNIAGELIMSIKEYQEGDKIRLTGMPAGLYITITGNEPGYQISKFIKR